MGNKVRIGIDVGGTFTDAVVIDNSTYEVIAKAKIPTTHHAETGVAAGIVQVIQTVLNDNHIDPDDVVFIAHGTTQATNALLEGDVAHVGIIGMGTGFEGERTKSETRVGTIELAPGKFLHTEHTYIDTAQKSEAKIDEALKQLKEQGAEVIVASKSYSVDDPEDEIEVIQQAQKQGWMATGGYEISQLYGLQARTRTAVVNAALIPKMMEAANMTESSVKQTQIKTPLMIMRCDGGVMSVEEVRKRPILTMLSGLAAGVAGAMMYEKVTDGIFFEVGGTSTDISVIKDGKVMVKNAQVGGRKLYLNSLDVRTLGIAGGSMIVVENGKITDVGPRSAHIAKKEYEVFTNAENLKGASLKLVAPCAEDLPHYAVVACDNGQEYALTLAGAANLLGYVPEEDYAHGNLDSARIAWQVLGEQVGMTAEEACRCAMDIAAAKVKVIVDELIADYQLNKQVIRFVGGGGSASIIPPYLGETMGIRSQIAKNAPYISTIGVALALMREQVERNVPSPSEDDIKKIRAEVIDSIVKNGANPDTVEVTIEIDAQKNILRAIATGATELRTKNLTEKTKSAEELERIALESVSGDAVIADQAHTGRWHAYRVQTVRSKLWGLLKLKKDSLRVVDDEGVIRLQKGSGALLSFNRSELSTHFVEFVDRHTKYSDAGASLPKVYLYFNQKMVDLSGVTTKDQLLSLADMECSHLDDSVSMIAVASHE